MLSCKCCAGQGERYRLTVSDGKTFCQAMLATQLNHMIVNKQVQSGGGACVQRCFARRRLVFLSLISPFAG